MNHLSARLSTRSTAYDRMNYFDLNHAVAQESFPETPWTPESLRGTPAAPILEDAYCREMIAVGVTAHLQGMGLTANEAGLPLQVWAERYVRRMGMAGTPVPFSTWGKVALRARVFYQCAEITRRDCFYARREL